MHCTALLLVSVFAQAPTPWIVDTDAGTDDYMAIAYLLAKPGVRIEAMVSVNGLSGSAKGAEVVARIAQLAAQPIPVYAGAARALKSKVQFPAEWRKMSEDLPGVELPPLRTRIPSAENYYAQRLTKPARILALGPLTNLALALQRNPALATNIQELVIMGGAVHVPGNLKDGDLHKTNNTTAEWNIYLDPEAADLVFRQVKTIRLVPLDATNNVPFRVDDVRRFERGATATPIGKFVTQILKLDEPMIRDGYYYAWDPLAAVAAATPAKWSFLPAAVRVSVNPGEEGRTAPTTGPPNIRMMANPSGPAFHTEFLSVFAKGKQ